MRLRLRLGGHERDPFVTDIGDYIFLPYLDLSVNSTRFYMLTLYSLVMSQQLRCLVELGGFLGNTSLILAKAVSHTDGRLYIFEHDTDLADKIYTRLTTALFDNFARVMCRHTTHADDLNLHPDLVFVDADHSYEAVKSDWAYWHPKVVVGGFMAFHDTITAPGVSKWVDETWPVDNWEFIELPCDTGFLLARKVA